MIILISKLKENIGTDINISQHIDVCIGSIINSILFGYRFDEVGFILKYAIFKNDTRLDTETGLLFMILEQTQ